SCNMIIFVDKNIFKIHNSRLGINNWKRNGKSRAFPELRFKSNGSFIIFNDVFDDSKAQSHPAAFGRELGFENPAYVLLFDSSAIIGHNNQHMVAITMNADDDFLVGL